MIGVLFDIEELDGGLYGYKAYRIFFASVDTRQLAGCSLSDGDTNATLFEGARQYCIRVSSFDPSQIAAVRIALSKSSANGLLPLASRFIDEPQVQHEPLVLAAHVGASGELVDCKTGWVTAAWKETQAQHHGSPSSSASSSLSAPDSMNRDVPPSPERSVSQPAAAVDTVQTPASSAPQVERPGCVTAYAFLSALGGIAVFGLMLVSSDQIDPPILLMVFLALSALALVIAVGLWSMRNWARLLVIALQGLSIAGTVLTACQTLQYDAEPATLVVSLVQVLVSGSIVWWFAENGHLFD